MSVSKEIKELVSILIEGLDVISEWSYRKQNNPFTKLQSEIHKEFSSFEKFSFKSNNSYPLFREEIRTMTIFMKSKLDGIKVKAKIEPKRSKENGIPVFRPVKIEETKEPFYQFALVGTLPTQFPTEDDTLIQKFIKNSLILIKSLKNLCGSKFAQFFEVLEEIFEVFLVELF